VTILGPHVITVVRPGRKPGDYGTGTVPDWDNATRAEVTGCSVQPVVGSDYTVDRDSTTTRWQAWVPPATDVAPTDRVEWRGDTYEVDGDVQRWDFPPLDHLIVPLVRSADA
jgi:hypothetical protein